MNNNNSDIRLWAFQNNVKMYEIAEKLGIHYVTLNGRLRKNLSTETKQEIYRIIDELKTEKGGK